MKIGSFKEAVTSEASIAQFLRTADDMMAAAQHPMPDSARFFLAYEGMFSVVMAVLEFHGVRPADTGGHRATAIRRVAVDLQLDVSRQSVLGRLHDVRNRVTYRAPLPPITKADADALLAILQEMLIAGKALIAKPADAGQR
ncbi:MAG: hypothetical protein GTN84_14775 [Hydrogenophaga sp.]|uniref:hypothetical protein n=1 Tax=Hydrogenophaga sp. TaxID=1904254 RepID=UPI0016B2DE15|nr:hypothetical protein [Hydrogenophaga sp.]NIM42431.1 hypothetical protein [Hydrogenophaga sp.]NIN27582.1 hypothetical protein [Hydrogenophaga sp.]NIN32402.1 hypothetical protein [Hydrogenophaga sp.]NIN56853.1 hypothetical protein [Hydrogenophaga sp.]NIO52998.1 hypothetical protein [Hydrogenophaga sp.]